MCVTLSYENKFAKGNVCVKVKFNNMILDKVTLYLAKEKLQFYQRINYNKELDQL